jgi:hypothetical protein
MESLVAYLVAAMVAWVPLYAHRTESADEARARYEVIARDAVTIAFDDGEAPLYAGPDGRAKTAVLMLAVASFESSFRPAVDDGVGRGDGGRSVCLMQIRVGAGTTREGWTGNDLVFDRTRCFRAALHILRSSFGTCRAYAEVDRLSAYATGRCLMGTEVSRARVTRARSWWMSHPLPKTSDG